MGKRVKPARIIRWAKPAKCPSCGNRLFLIVVYVCPSNIVWDNVEKFDLEGYFLSPQKKVRDNRGNFCQFLLLMFMYSNKDCRLKVFDEDKM